MKLIDRKQTVRSDALTLPIISYRSAYLEVSYAELSINPYFCCIS